MYNKLFTKILDSSVWLEDTETRIVWLTFLAAMDEDGFCAFAAVGNVAHRARVSPEAAEAAVNTLESPDPDSADKDNEGRRIQRVAGGWLILNAHKYRSMVNREIVREQTRARVAKHRQTKGVTSEPVTQCNGDVTLGNEIPSVYASDSESVLGKGDARGKGFEKPSLEAVEQYATELGMPGQGQPFMDHYDSNGWKVGKVAMKDWKASVRNWKRTHESRNQNAKRGQNNKPNPRNFGFAANPTRDADIARAAKARGANP